MNSGEARESCESSIIHGPLLPRSTAPVFLCMFTCVSVCLCERARVCVCVCLRVSMRVFISVCLVMYVIQYVPIESRLRQRVALLVHDYTTLEI